MLAVLNNTFISQLKTTGKQYDVRDKKLKGFLIRVTSTGKKNYVCEYKRGRRINIGKVGILTPAQARDKAIQILSDVSKGIDPSNKKEISPDITLKSFIEKEYQPWVLSHRQDGANTIARIK
jgi:hypothetical protein